MYVLPVDPRCGCGASARRCRRPGRAGDTRRRAGADLRKAEGAAADCGQDRGKWQTRDPCRRRPRPRTRRHGPRDPYTVLIAAVFCLCNRYVDGLATWTPSDPEFYRERAKVIVDNGYTLATTKT